MAERNACDILVVGGSLAGLAAAITAKEAQPSLDVLIMEKYTTGYAGKANRGAGIMLMRGEYAAEDFVQYQTHGIGNYINDQDALRQYAEGLNDGVADLDRWSSPDGKSSGKFAKKDDGSIQTLKWRSQVTGETPEGKRTFNQDNEYPWTLAAIDLDYLLNVRKTATRLGVRFVDRVGLVDLLLDAGRASGAVGYHIDTGEQTVIEAKAVVLACGGQNWRVMPMWSCTRGEGVASAWRAGARLSNCEFSNFYNWTSLDNFESEMGVEYALYNDKGENVGKPYTKEPHPDIDSGSLSEWYKQVKAGNGPMHYHMDENILMPFLSSMLGTSIHFKRPYTDRLWGNLFFNAFSQSTGDLIVPGLIGEFGPVAADLEMATSVPGLYSAGDISYGGCRGFGAVPAPPGRMRGSGLAFACYSGRTAGASVARYAAEAQQGKVFDSQLGEIDARFTGPAKRERSIAPRDFLYEVQKVMQPLGNNLYHEQGRMESALARVLELREELPKVQAQDPHNLFAVNELDSMLLCSELKFKAAMARKESRGWFLREDYPETSKELKWYSFENEGGEAKLREEDVPIASYRYRPE